VLVVEDEADIRDVISEILGIYGFSVSLASDGLEGWGLVGANSYDLIITDLGIPGINGLELVRRVRAASINTPVLIITGVIFENSDSEVKAMRPVEILLKPFRIEDLMRKIASLPVVSDTRTYEAGKVK
jgi:DNA-binding response OmpR family regulator